MKKFLWLIFVFMLLLVSVSPAFAQDADFTLRLNRDFGYGGFDGEIEGLFSVIAVGPDALQRVEFYIDGELMNTDDAVPFRYQFTTKNYAPGMHTLTAIGFTGDGSQLHSNEVTRLFLSPEESREKIIALLVPMFAFLFILVIGVTVVPMLFGRKKPQPGKYGISGGAVCPNCNLPFPIHFFSFHAGPKNYERCPHCGKWSWVRKASKEDLAAAEARWVAPEVTPLSEDSKAQRIKRQIDESRYDN